MSYTGSKAFAGRSTQLQRGDGGGPETFTTLSEIHDISFGSGKMDLADVTNMDSGNFREKLATLNDWGDVTAKGNYLGNVDASQANLIADFRNQTLRNFKIVLPGGKGTWTFAAFVSQPPSPNLAVDKAADFSIKLSVTGDVTFA